MGFSPRSSTVLAVSCRTAPSPLSAYSHVQHPPTGHFLKPSHQFPTPSLYSRNVSFTLLWLSVFWNVILMTGRGVVAFVCPDLSECPPFLHGPFFDATVVLNNQHRHLPTPTSHYNSIQQQCNNQLLFIYFRSVPSFFPFPHAFAPHAWNFSMTCTRLLQDGSIDNVSIRYLFLH